MRIAATGTYDRSPRNALAGVPAQPQAATWIRLLLYQFWLADSSNPPIPLRSFRRVDAGRCRLYRSTMRWPGSPSVAALCVL